jgi:hypothetical protein
MKCKIYPDNLKQNKNPTEVKLRDKMGDKATRMLDQTTTDQEKSTMENKIEKTHQEIDLLVFEVYELTDEEIGMVESI